MMILILDGLIALIALLHVYFLALEMFLWTTSYGLRAFDQSLEKAQDSKVLAANQGLYNGFLAAGLIWAMIRHGGLFDIAPFFLSCIVAAGACGGVTVRRKIFFVQAVPAIIALALIIWTKAI